jgi:hypothetical protein
MGRLPTIILCLFFPALSMLAHAQDYPYPQGSEPVPSLQLPPGVKGRGLDRGYRQDTPDPGSGYPGNHPGATAPGSPAHPATGLQPPVVPGAGEGQLSQPQVPMDAANTDGVYPAYGPPPGLGGRYGRQRPRGGPGYPGLRGPGFGYPRHRQYGNPPLYPIQGQQEPD